MLAVAAEVRFWSERSGSISQLHLLCLLCFGFCGIYRVRGFSLGQKFIWRGVYEVGLRLRFGRGVKLGLW